MKFSLLLSLVFGISHAFDAVVFSPKKNLDISSVDAVLAAATSEEPLYIFVNHSFTLAKFSRLAAAYSLPSDNEVTSSSLFVNATKSATSKTQLHINNEIHIGATWSFVNATNPHKKGSAVIIVQAENWKALETIAAPLLQLPATAFVVTNSEAFKKKIKLDMPLLLPPVNYTETNGVRNQTCLLYLEGLNFVLEVRKEGQKPEYTTATFRTERNTTADASTSANSTFTWDESFVHCEFLNLTKRDNRTHQNATETALSYFLVHINPVYDPIAVDEKKNTTLLVVKGPFHFNLTFEHRYSGYWRLKEFKLLDDIKFKSISSATVALSGSHVNETKLIGMGSVFGYGWNCHNTEVAFFDTDKTSKTPRVNTSIRFGIGFHSIQVQLFSHNNKSLSGLTVFDLKIDSCTGTFSAGSLMGIIVVLIFAAAFSFAFLMLNSVQSQDRFDDPKKRQIVINSHE